MIDNVQKAAEQFESHVPYSSAAFLVLQAHLVVEVRLLEFIKARISPELFKEVERPREGSFQVRLLLARALAERDEIPPDNTHILWPALEQLGKLRNDVAHTLEHRGTSLADKMCDFVQKVDPSGELLGKSIPRTELHKTFRSAASYLNSLLAIQREPFLIADVLQEFPNGG